jgi:hypothetical protein
MELEVDLRIELLSVHVLRINSSEDEEIVQDGLDVTLHLPPWSGPVGLKDLDIDVTSFQTNEYWDEFPELIEEALREDSGIWQQTLWKVSGIFLIPGELPISSAVQQLQFDLDFHHNFTEDQLEIDDDYYFKVLTFSQII